MCDIDIDITQSRPLRLGIAVSDQILWDNDSAAERIRGVDLSDIARKSAHARRCRPDVDVVADIDVLIAAEARTARAMLNPDTDETGCSTLLYVGTPAGLASLIADIHALGIADGAVLVPRAAGVVDVIRDAVLPLLQTGLQLPAAAREAHSA
jgi:alkanesulfonate monooxygenase SsuD/methylene tetrahydromethanopterin reductase-like flavin-dependent oxidoreductase (luciferase family)